jgi:hypothetical protein
MEVPMYTWILICIGLGVNIHLGGACGPTTIAPENVPHLERGQAVE